MKTRNALIPGCWALALILVMSVGAHAQGFDDTVAGLARAWEECAESYDPASNTGPETTCSIYNRQVSRARAFLMGYVRAVVMLARDQSGTPAAYATDFIRCEEDPSSGWRLARMIADDRSAWGYEFGMALWMSVPTEHSDVRPFLEEICLE